MNNFALYNPTYFVFGRDTQSQVGALTRRFGGTRALIHYGGGSVVRSGLLDVTRASLAAAGVSFVELGGAVPNPRSGLAYEGIALCKREGVDFVIGIGGGSAIDSAKAIAAGAVYPGDFWDLYMGKAPYEKALPIGCILTLPATGTEGSNSAVITHEDGMVKRGLSGDANRPAFAILNPELTFSLPPYQTACGVADMMAHIFERYFTNTENVDVTDRLCEAVLQTIVRAAPIAMQNPEDYAARADLMWAGTIAHNGQLGVGREEDWASHNIGHELSGAYDLAHGASLSIIMPHWMRFTLPGHAARFAQMATRVFGCEMDSDNPERTAIAGIERLAAFWASLGLPLTMKEIGIPKEDIPTLAQKARVNAQGILGAYTPLTRKEIQTIYEMSYE
ncbi:MAG: iron-containing alcohol dehydrogenase [Oscillospiraceae bacterium]|jgi:alcohol dehydrogenase YqhD (iron-dependent ADH family)|nr:iron-containing alcohol dehydrogenase [Oscillospiraceae bacterium]